MPSFAQTPLRSGISYEGMAPTASLASPPHCIVRRTGRGWICDWSRQKQDDQDETPYRRSGQRYRSTRNGHRSGSTDAFVPLARDVDRVLLAVTEQWYFSLVTACTLRAWLKRITDENMTATSQSSRGGQRDAPRSILPRTYFEATRTRGAKRIRPLGVQSRRPAVVDIHWLSTMSGLRRSLPRSGRR